MIVDKVRITIKAGNGGNVAVSFHREKYVAAGGPDGGDGGRGGDVIFVASDEKRTLMDFRFKTKFSAQNGEQGRKNNMTGKDGADLIIEVPAGTVIIDGETGRIVADIRGGVRKTVLKGGRGGKGNARFCTPTRRAPRFATPGRKTEPHTVILELKSIADVGLVGFPNVGKSTLLSVVTAAKPKIADYHFTTLSPNLGVASIDDTSFIIADIPGLIEGASEGAGLGHNFLRHVERTRMLVHVLDASGIEGRDPIEDYYKIRAELDSYNAELGDCPEIIVANKTDITGAEENVKRIREEFEPKGKQVFAISAATHKDTDKLLRAIAAVLRELPPAEDIPSEGVIEEWELSGGELTFDITRGMDGIVDVDGTLIDDIFEKINPDDPDSMRHFEKLLVDKGVISALREFGVKDGEDVRLGGEEFTFVD